MQEAVQQFLQNLDTMSQLHPSSQLHQNFKTLEKCYKNCHLPKNI